MDKRLAELHRTVTIDPSNTKAQIELLRCLRKLGKNINVKLVVRNSELYFAFGTFQNIICHVEEYVCDDFFYPAYYWYSAGLYSVDDLFVVKRIQYTDPVWDSVQEDLCYFVSPNAGINWNEDPSFDNNRLKVNNRHDFVESHLKDWDPLEL